MENRSSQCRTVWLVAGLMAGLCISYFWPHEPALAVATDRNDKFAMLTAPISLVSNVVNNEAIFVLDFLTGQLHGRFMNTSRGQFTQQFFRNVGNDFNVDPNNQNVRYSIVVGGGQLSSGTRGVQPASSLIYIGELNSGKVICYTFPINQRNVRGAQATLLMVDQFQFRDAVNP